MVLFSSYRMDLHLEVARELDANATEPERMTAIQPDRNFDDKLFYSKDKRIYSSNIGQRNSRLILTTEEEIVSLQQINVETYLVREKSSVKLYSTGKKNNKGVDLHRSFCQNQSNPSTPNCNQQTPIHFGSTAVDFANDFAYYTVASTIYQVSISDSIAITPFQLFRSFGNVHAMT